MTVEHVGIALLAWVILGTLLARQFRERRRRARLNERLSSLIEAPSPVHQLPSLLVRSSDFASLGRVISLSGLWRAIDMLLGQSGLSGMRNTFLVIECLLFSAPLLLTHFIGGEMPVALALSLVLPAIPVAILFVRRIVLRRKFMEQLPNAIDLMVAVLKSGHSLPMAVKSVGEEIANPLGGEFQEVLARMNLGQPMAEALQYSSERFSSYELDLIRRAIAIQAEVGGSLAELLEKTNLTLRQRIKLARHVKVLTAQSRLTAVIVGLMPFAVALGLSFLNPGYLDPLLTSSIGHMLLAVALVLQILGVFIMTRLSTVKV